MQDVEVQRGDLMSGKIAEVAVCSRVWKGAVWPPLPNVEYILMSLLF